MVSEDLAARLREKAEAFEYDGWVETACDYREAATAIEALNNMAAEYKAAYVEEHDRRIAEAKRFQDGILGIIRNVVEMRPFGVLERKPVDMEDGK